jgi:uncharacterized membrane protein HdeD (DUF308 family)
MLDMMTRTWWAVALRGTVAVLFGLVAMIWPGITLFALLILFGAYALVDGAFAIGSAFFGENADASSRAWLAVRGVAGIVIGLMTFFWPGVTALVLLYLIAAWAIVSGVLEVAAAIRLRKEIRGEWLMALAGVLSVVFGILLAVWPAAGAVTLVLFIGAFALVFGVVLIGLAFRLRHLRSDHAAPAGTARPATA